MHNMYIHDLFTEGLGDIFFMKYYNFLKKKIKNKVLNKFLVGIHVFFYLVFLIGIVYLFFRLSYPL